MSEARISNELTYREEVWRESAPLQRRLLLTVGVVYALAMLWVSFSSTVDASFAILSLGLLLATLVLYGMSFLRDRRVRLEIIPALFALLYSAHVVLWITLAPAHGSLRAALLLSLLGFVLLLLAPLRRSFLAAQAILVFIGTYAAVILWPRDLSPVATREFFIYWLPGVACAIAVAAVLENVRRRTFQLRCELARRATSDQITGVSNQAHIKLLAQNEFARARRYAEPYSALMFEIDAYDSLSQAQDTIVQVFSGYCVVVMRHCDSFGRLTPARFLALLPETPGEGALKLSTRMCAEVSALDVMVAGAPVRFTISVGIAELHTVDRNSVDLLKRAQQALDDAIERGGNAAILAALPGVIRPSEDPAEAGLPPIL